LAKQLPKQLARHLATRSIRHRCANDTAGNAQLGAAHGAGGRAETDPAQGSTMVGVGIHLPLLIGTAASASARFSPRP